MKKKVYVQPAMMVVELQHGMNILQYSRSAYGSGGSGYDDSDIGGRSGYGSGGSGYGSSSVGSRSGYGMGGDGWD